MGCLVLTDAGAFAAGYFLVRYGHQMPAFVLPGRIPDNAASATDIYLIMGALFIGVRYMFGDYGRRQPFWDGARATTNTLALICIPDALFVVLVGDSALYAPLVLSWIFLIPGIPLLRQGARWCMSQIGLWGDRTVLIGAGPEAVDALQSLRGALSLGFDVRYVLVNDLQEAAISSLEGLQPVAIRNPAAAITKLQDLGCTQAIVAADTAGAPRASELIQRLIGADINVAIIPSLRGLPLFGLRTNYLFGKDLLLLQVRNNLARIPSRAIKRIVDLIVPVLAVIVASPLLVAIMVAIKLDDGGPIFFVQQRVGRRGRPFPCFKFRTMAVNAEDMLAAWRHDNPDLYAEYVRSNFKLRKDPRVTRVGRWLRRTSFDEIPQVLNVIVGDMSLVGPRPLLEREIPDYGTGFELYQRTRPGITGLWQISGRSETRFAQRVSYDEWYILNWSLWYDIVILIQTAWIVLARKGAF